jgi:hypothetical protein
MGNKTEVLEQSRIYKKYNEMRSDVAQDNAGNARTMQR